MAAGRGSALIAALPLAVAMLAIAGVARAGETYEGLAYARSGGQLLYRERHWIAGDRHLVLYYCPDGRAFARKRIDTGPGATSPNFEVFDARDGYHAGVRAKDGQREVFVRDGRGGRLRSAPVRGRPVIDAGFDVYLRDAWQRLAGGPLTTAFLVPGRLGALQFRVQRLSTAPERSRFRLGLATWFGKFLPDIHVDYATATRRLLRYRGISDVRDGDGKQLDVDIRFPPDRRRAAGIADLEHAAATELDGRCRQ